MSKPIIRTKILHLQLRDPVGGDYTLLTEIIDGSIKYMLYDGHSSYGTRFPLSQLGMPSGVYLPVETKYEDETMDEFRERVLEAIREQSRMIIVRVVENQVKFYQP
jgi:hypothetical protein